MEQEVGVNCKNIVDCVDFLITSTSELSKYEQSAFLKVLVLQIHCSSPQRCYELMEKYLEIELSKDSGKVDMIILPEGAISYLGELPQSSIPLELQCLSNFAANHHIILICGTVTETAMINSEMKCFTTCVVFDQQGEVILKYRKRDTMGMMEDGNQVGICDTIYGKIGVLICYDAERPAFVDDTIAHSPSLIFNPSHLSTFQGIPKSLIHSSWKVALDTSSRYFEYLAHSTGVTFVRCDLAGSGNTFLVTPKQSVFIPSLSEQYMSILIPNPHHSSDNFSSSERQLTLSSDFGRIRTEKFDNTGLRATIQTMEIERKKSWKTNGMVLSERGGILKVGIILPRGRPKGRIAILSDSSLEIWDPVDSSLFYSYDLNQCPSLETDQQSESNSKSIRFVDGIIEREGVIRVHDNRQRCYEWIPTQQSYELIAGTRALDAEVSVIAENLDLHNDPTKISLIDSLNREWVMSLDQIEEDLKPSPYNYNRCSSLSFRIRGDHQVSEIPCYQVVLPTSCQYHSHPSDPSSHAPTGAILHYEQGVNYIPIITSEKIHLIQFFHNRVSVKILDILSSFLSSLET